MCALTSNCSGRGVWNYVLLFLGTVLPNSCVLYWAWGNGYLSYLPSLFLLIPEMAYGATGGAVASPILAWLIGIGLLILALILWGIVYMFFCGIVGIAINPIICILDSLSILRQVLVVATLLFTVVTSILFNQGATAIEIATIAKMHITCFSCLVIEGALLLMGGNFEEDYTYVSGSHYEISFGSDGVGTASEVTEYSDSGGYVLNTARFILWALAVVLGGILVFVIKVITLRKSY